MDPITEKKKYSILFKVIRGIRLQEKLHWPIFNMREQAKEGGQKKKKSEASRLFPSLRKNDEEAEIPLYCGGIVLGFEQTNNLQTSRAICLNSLKIKLICKAIAKPQTGILYNQHQFKVLLYCHQVM